MKNGVFSTRRRRLCADGSLGDIPAGTNPNRDFSLRGRHGFTEMKREPACFLASSLMNGERSGRALDRASQELTANAGSSFSSAAERRLPTPEFALPLLPLAG